MADPADGSSHNRPGWHLADGCVSTRNRKAGDVSASLRLVAAIE
jgi:hypothetical protein